VTYASETWVLTKENERALNTWERKIMRKTYGPINEGRPWRIRTKSELQEVYGEQDLVQPSLRKVGCDIWDVWKGWKTTEFRSECCMTDQEEEGRKEDTG
jgi:hypothetical protein